MTTLRNGTPYEIPRNTTGKLPEPTGWLEVPLYRQVQPKRAIAYHRVTKNGGYCFIMRERRGRWDWSARQFVCHIDGTAGTMKEAKRKALAAIARIQAPLTHLRRKSESA